MSFHKRYKQRKSAVIIPRLVEVPQGDHEGRPYILKSTCEETCRGEPRGRPHEHQRALCKNPTHTRPQSTTGSRLRSRRRLKPCTNKVKRTTAYVEKIKDSRFGTSNGRARTRARESAPRRPLQKIINRHQGRNLPRAGVVYRGRASTITKRASSTATMVMPAISKKD